MNHKPLIIAMLRKGPVRTSHFLQAHIGRFGARIGELRHEEGYEISTKRIRQGESEYRLVSERCEECKGNGKIAKYVVCPLCDGEIVAVSQRKDGWWSYGCGECEESFADPECNPIYPCAKCNGFGRIYHNGQQRLL